MAVLGTVAPGAMAQAPTTPVARHLDGTVTSVARQDRAFRMRTESGRVIRIKVNRGTRFERIAGFAGLRRGQVIEVTARRRDGRWVAIEVERRRRDNDRRGGEDDRGGDDRRGGDDGGRGRGGHDDGPNHT